MRKVILKFITNAPTLEECWRRRESCPQPAKVSLRVTKHKSL